MPRQTANLIENNFNKGLITDANPLNYPQHASIDTFNCIFDLQGRVSRRTGFDYEVNYDEFEVPIYDGENYTEYLWTSVSGDGTISFVVQQQGNFLHLYNVSQNTFVSANFSISIGLSSPALNTTTKSPAKYPCAYAQGNGDLFVCNEACEPFYIHYDIDTQTFTSNVINIQFRDFEGATSDTASIPDRFGVDLNTLYTSFPGHYYNLLNQGWYTSSALSDWDAARGDLPSNADRVALYRSSATVAFTNTRVGPTDPGNTRAPNGHFILDLADSDRDRAIVQQASTFTAVSLPVGDNHNEIQSRPSAVAFYASRIFYSGINAHKHGSKIYFTQLIEGSRQYGYCFQTNDPTSESLFDLLPTDGGVINIPEVATINRLFSYQNSLVVVASNGVWLIAGSRQGGFAANDYTVRKISSIGSVSPLSIVDAAGVPMWWGEDGIYTIEYNSQYDTFTVQSITTGVINQFIDENVGATKKKFVKGTYDTSNFIVHWLYNDGSLSYDYGYNGVLSMNTISKAFYPWTISAGTPAVRGALYVRDALHQYDPTVKFCVTRTGTTGQLISFAELTTDKYADWFTFDNVDYDSYFITGYTFPGELQRFGQPNYVFMYYEQFPDSSFKVNALYDFSLLQDSGKFSSSAQLVSTSPISDRVLATRKVKLRGKGRSIQIRVTSVSDQPFTIIGWSIWETVTGGI